MSLRLLATAVVVSVVALGAASSARAHATLLSTRPASGAVLERAPRHVTLRFDDAVETSLGSIEVTDVSGGRVDDGTPSQPDPKQLTVGLAPGLLRGTHDVSWRVVSDDGHPIAGTFSFSIGEPNGTASGASPQASAGQTVSKAVDVTFGVVRFLNLALILLCAGGALALAIVFVGESTDVRRLPWMTLGVAGLLLAVASLAGIGLEGAQARGGSLGSAFKLSFFGDVLDTRFGKVWLVREGLALVFALVTSLALGSRRERVFSGTAVALSLALTITPALSGHAHDEGAFAVVSDWVHVSAAAAWTGALAFVLLVLLLSRGRRWAIGSRIVPRFSALALVSVATLLAAGVANSLFEIPAVGDLWGTTYGRLLLVKIGLVLPLLGLGAFNNRLAVPRLRSGLASALERRRFLVVVGAELSIVAAVLGVTAALVAENPARAESRPVATGPVSRELRLGPYSLDVYVDPARAGENTIHLTLFDPRSKKLAPVHRIDVSASSPSDGAKPPLRTFALGRGHLVVVGDLRYPGDWRLEVGVRKGARTAWKTGLTVPIAS